jgi:hypothetical protein
VSKLGTPIVCNEFDVVAHLQGTTLDIRLDTDLPDFTEIMVSVSRSYREKGNSQSRYPIDYFSEKSTVGKWRTSHAVSVADQVFRDALQKQLDRMAALGAPFEVADVEDTIDVSITVPIHQANSAFGPENVNLVGDMVAEEGFRVVRKEMDFNRPLDDGASLDPAPRKAHHASLDVGATYRLSAATPLMPEFEPRDPLSAISRIVKLPPESRIVVLRTRMQGSRPWYYVSAYDSHNSGIGKGWINSGALVGMDIHVVRAAQGERGWALAAFLEALGQRERSNGLEEADPDKARQGGRVREHAAPDRATGQKREASGLPRIRVSNPSYSQGFRSAPVTIRNPYVSTSAEEAR